MNKTCESCIYWLRGGDSDDGYQNYLDTGICRKATMFWDSTEWREDEETFIVNRSLKKQFVGNGMFVQDGSDYSATLITEPDFYCNKYCSVDEKQGPKILSLVHSKKPEEPCTWNGTFGWWESIE